MRRATDPLIYRAQSLNATIWGGEVTPCVSVLLPRPPAGDCGAGGLALPAPPRHAVMQQRGGADRGKLASHNIMHTSNPVQDIPTSCRFWVVVVGQAWSITRSAVPLGASIQPCRPGLAATAEDGGWLQRTPRYRSQPPPHSLLQASRLPKKGRRGPGPALQLTSMHSLLVSCLYQLHIFWL